MSVETNLEQSPPRTPLRALVIEDSEDDTLLLVDTLTRAHFDVAWERLDTERQLLDALRKPWDIVFSDYSMPDFTGARALAVVKDVDPDLPFIFVSGTIGEETAVNGMRAGAQDYVMKGNLTRLIPAVHRELADARVRRERRVAEHTVRQLSRVVEQAADSVFITDPHGTIQYVNPSFERITGYSAQEAIGATPALFKSDRQDAAFYRRLWETISSGHVFHDTLINRRKDGALFYEEKTIAPLYDSPTHISNFVSTGRDVTERIHAEQMRTRLLEIIEATTDLVAILNSDGRLRYLNRAGRRMLGFDNEDVTVHTLPDFHPDWAAERVWMEAFPIARRDGAWHGETALKARDGKEIPVSQVVIAHGDGSSASLGFYSTIARDITERKRFEEELKRQATHDALSALPNRVLFQEQVATELIRAERGRFLAAVLFIDIDNFKRVNESLGHAAGDAILRRVAARLRECMRPTDVVARYGGDKFTILISGLASPDHILVALHKLRAAFETPLPIGGRDLYLGFSVGISVYPSDGQDPESLLRNSETAMYRAKANGRNQHQFYAPAMNARGQELLALETDLRRALERKEFVLYYQPQLDLRTGRIDSAEALLRWPHPNLGLMPPDSFVPLLEETGLILPVGEWVLRTACAQYRKLREAGGPALRLSVNVSALQFGDRALLDRIRQALREEDVPPEHLEIEITESTVMRDAQTAGDILAGLDTLGVRLALDDFGTGYSSLAYLQRFPLDVLKIDRGFLRGVPDSAHSAIAEASISLGHRLGMEIVAEGVDTEAQIAFLRRHACDLAQGNYVSEPRPMEDILPLVSKAAASPRR